MNARAGARVLAAVSARSALPAAGAAGTIALPGVAAEAGFYLARRLA